MSQGKRAVVVGVANARSIAWGIADRWRKEGAEVFVTYQSERFRKPVEKLLRDSWGPYPAGAPMPATACDITSEEDLAALWRTLQERGFCSSSSSSLSEAAGGSELAGATTNDVQARRGSGGGDGSAEAAKLEQRQRGDVIFNSSSSSNSSSGSGRKYSCTDIDSREGGHVGAVTEGGDRSEATKVPANKTIDVVLHSVAHAPTDAMRQGLIKGTTRDAFVSAHVVSAYSLVSTVRHALPFLSPGASVVALTYIGSQRAATNYNVMGPAKASLESCARALAAELGGQGEGCRNSSGDGAIGPGGVRVNCLSPGPVRTMAARGISGFDEMRREAAERAPLGRGADLEEIAGVATFLASPLSSAVTGQTVYADCGLSAVL